MLHESYVKMVSAVNINKNEVTILLGADVVDVSIDKNNVTLNNRKGTLITQSASQVKVDLVDYRWHQLCLNAASAKTQAYLDNKLLFEIDQGTNQTMRTDEGIIKFKAVE